jgi:thioredoxin reductase (NADPH)
MWVSATDVPFVMMASTGADVAGDRRPMETSRKGIFAIGDVRSGSVKRVAAAVGEGAQVVATLHGFLAATDRRSLQFGTN